MPVYPILKLNNVNNGSGQNGLSAYEIAVQNGFVGTQSQWLESLKATGVVTTYVHTQNIAAAVWTIPHNLSQQFVSAHVIDFAGNILLPEIEYISANIINLTFIDAVQGTARITR